MVIAWEIEVRDAEVAGVATRQIHGEPYSASSHSFLIQAEILGNFRIFSWINTSGAQYPAYTSYILALELLRLTMLNIGNGGLAFPAL
ncbi:MAG: hypothetical protein DRJ61_01390 [Acidobacteria bacterium]|nr:MAG: hypothetical protein DRH08_02405 [Deltaproteobacteria bacterium]RLE36161.1 MAG: hypothetical protein DRJ61_01390 [Acidobacteriota bacterium]